MSINHFSSSDLPETLWWAQHHHHKMESSKKNPSSKPTTANFWTNSHLLYPHHQQQQNINPMMSQNSGFGGRFDLNNNNNNEDDEEIEDQNVITDHDMMMMSENNNYNNHNNIVKQEEPEVVVDYYHQQDQELLLQKQPLFEKPLTPSDVGKLNRLVIPKQHAEKYFPLNGGGGGGGSGGGGGGGSTATTTITNNHNSDSSTGGEKGLLLSFEDELGKPWKFRYSYWNSSQSYVLTKGWSRFVKEKKLDAGDVVLFERHPLHSDRLFIGWRRRNVVPVSVPPGATTSHDTTHQTPAPPPPATTAVGAGGGGGGGWTRLFFSGHPYPPQPHSHGPALHLPYQPDCLHAAAATILQSQTATPSGNAGNSKRLRLFGVNLDLECQQPPLPEEEEEEDYSDQPPTPEEGSSESSQSQAQYQYYQQYFTNHKLHHPHMMTSSTEVNSGPMSPVVLNEQNQRMTSLIWAGKKEAIKNALGVRRFDSRFFELYSITPTRVRELLDIVGFGGSTCWVLCS